MTIADAIALGLRHHQAGQLAEAENLYRQVLAVSPQDPDALHLLGAIAHQVGQHAEAVALIRRAIAVIPDVAEYHCNLGLALNSTGALDDAIAAYRHALALKPAYPEAHYNLGNALRDCGRIEEAIESYRRAIELRPHFPEAHCNLANQLGELGRLEEAIAERRRALLPEPGDPTLHSQLLFTLQYLPGLTRQELQAEQRRWDRFHATPLRSAQPHANDRAPNRRLRIGYVSGDLRDHVVGRTFLPCFEAHDRASFDFYCYSTTPLVDAISERFQRHAAVWRVTTGLSDDALTRLIREDRIDILVDLSLHSLHNRLLVFARQPAPVQVSWLGYPGTTGLTPIDYHFADPFLSPPGEADSDGDRPLRLPECWCSYGAPEDSPEPNELPALTRGQVTFGSFNNLSKINDRVLALWAAILRGVPGSRLLLLSKSGPLPHIVEGLARHGAPPGAVGFLEYFPPAVEHGALPPLSYLRRYWQVDIALDPFPYNGMTTTCDALWMSVPVVALIGDRPTSRASFSLLSNIGLPELAAPSEAEYVEIATRLAFDLPRLAALRSTLRRRMQDSPLLDAPRLARQVEAAYRKIWQRWCTETLDQPGA